MNHSYIAHDCLIGDGSTIASGAKISGTVHVGKEVYLGTNSSVTKTLILMIYVCLDQTLLQKEI